MVQQALPHTRFVNLYGPTEITCNCTYFKVDRAFEDTDALPIGVPFKNSRVFLMDENNTVIEELDQIGEICVAGTSLALGYYNNPQKTQEVFCQNPTNSNYFERIYRTGDMGKYNERGELLFISRKDFQIKHMGHRIELGELEVIINSFSFITSSCCLYDTKREKIVCFYQSDICRDKELALGIGKHLPKYMWPNRYVFLEAMPMSKNNKIDRVRLREEYIDYVSH